MAGIFFAVVGASGAGKDAILSASKSRLESIGDYYFPTRFITRPKDAGDEEHSSLSNTEFVQAVRDDRFSLWWKAHKMNYGLPENVYEKLRAGTHVIANISRRSVGDAVNRFNRVEIIEIAALSENISKRLLLRARETEAEIQVRQLREIDPQWSGDLPVTTIRNDGVLGEAVDQFIESVLRLSDQNARRAQIA